MIKDMLKFVCKIMAEILSIFRISKEDKRVEMDMKNKEPFIKRKVRQDEVDKLDKNEKLVREVVDLKGKEREKRLDEIRKIISK